MFDVDPLSAGPDHLAAAQALATGVDVGCSTWRWLCKIGGGRPAAAVVEAPRA